MDQIRKTTNMEKLRSGLDKASGKDSKAKNYHDDRFWKLTRDKNENGSAVIRFLPAPQGEEEAFVLIWSHGFMGPTKQYYIENSLTTLKQQDYIAEQNKLLWDTGTDANRDIARSRKRIINYFSNIYVVNDPANPDNNGKVFLFKYGVKIFEMLQSAAFPPFEDMASINPFDFEDGANFRLRIRTENRYPTYADSKFDMPSKLFDGDEDKIVEVWQKEHSLRELMDKKNFKSYEDLKARYLQVVNVDGAPIPSAEHSSNRNTFEEEDVPLFQSNNDPKPSIIPKSSISSLSSTEDDDDDDMSFFASLASGE